MGSPYLVESFFPVYIDAPAPEYAAALSRPVTIVLHF